MNRNFFLLSIALCTMVIFACKNTTDSGAENNSGKDSVIIKTENPLPSATFGITPDPDRFPYVEVLNDSTTLLQAYTVKFKLSHHYPLGPVTSERLYWIDETNSNEMNGVFLHYFILGREISLSATQVRVDYFSKKNPSSSKVDSVFEWMDGYFLQSEKAKVIKDIHPVSTQTDKPFYVQELYSVRNDSLSPKFLALAYMDYNADYIVGVNLTAVDSFEYKDALPFYYQLLGSFAE